MRHFLLNSFWNHARRLGEKGVQVGWGRKFEWRDHLSRNCEVEGDLDWCEFACIEAINGNDWYYNSEVVFACDASGYEGNYDEFKTDDDDDDEEFVSFKRIHEANYDTKRVAEVSLADKGVAVENSSSNAGYYIAGVSLLSAATVVYIVS